jgi:hypothetical protein
LRQESESESEFEFEEYDYDAIEDLDERELILSIERNLDLYKSGAYGIGDVMTTTETDIEVYRNKKDEPIMTTISTDSNDSSDKLTPLKKYILPLVGHYSPKLWSYNYFQEVI